MHFKTYLPLIPFFVTVATALLSAEPGEFQLIDILENGVSLRNNTLFFIDGISYSFGFFGHHAYNKPTS
jgi:hypothetical protein